jgi:hypothetical protein
MEAAKNPGSRLGGLGTLVAIRELVKVDEKKPSLDDLVTIPGLIYSSIYVPIYGPIGRNSEILALPLQGNNNLTVLKGTVESWLLHQSVVQPLQDSRFKYFNTNCLVDVIILFTSISSTAVLVRADVLTTESPEREEDCR